MKSSPERILLLAALGLLTILFVWFQWRLLLLTFAGFLLAVLLRTAIGWLEHHTPLNPMLAYTATLVTIAALSAVAVLVLGPRFIDQLSKVSTAVLEGLAQARAYLEQQPSGHVVLDVVNKAMSGGNMGSHVTLMAKSLVDSVVDLVIIGVIGFFGALNPHGYKNGLLLLLPEENRPRAREISGELVATLRWWLLGQMVPMACIGVASMIALWLLGVHLAFTLGLLTGLMVFVPYVGSILSGIPALLLAFQRGPRTALYVLILYSIFHLVEGDLLTPLVQKKAVRLPPVLTVLSQFFLWSFGGVLGVAVAAPLAAAGMVLVKNLYLSYNSTEKVSDVR